MKGTTDSRITPKIQTCRNHRTESKPNVLTELYREMISEASRKEQAAHKGKRGGRPIIYWVPKSLRRTAAYKKARRLELKWERQ